MDWTMRCRVTRRVGAWRRALWPRVVEAVVRATVISFTSFVDVIRIDCLQGFYSGLSIILKNRNIFKWSHQKPKKTYNSQISPVQQVTEAFSSVSLDDALSAVQSGEVVHVLSKLLNRVLESDEATVDNVDAVGLRVANMFLHEAPEAGEVCGDAGNAHHRAFRWRVAPRLVIGRKDAWKRSILWESCAMTKIFFLTQMTPTHEFIVLESKQWIRGVQEFGMENNLHTIIHAVEEIATTNPKREKRLSDSAWPLCNQADYLISWRGLCGRNVTIFFNFKLLRNFGQII